MVEELPQDVDPSKFPSLALVPALRSTVVKPPAAAAVV
jgi:hypothetical protein